MDPSEIISALNVVGNTVLICSKNRFIFLDIETLDVITSERQTLEHTPVATHLIIDNGRKLLLVGFPNDQIHAFLVYDNSIISTPAKTTATQFFDYIDDDEALSYEIGNYGL